jgi:hypothetical protein
VAEQFSAGGRETTYLSSETTKLQV